MRITNNMMVNNVLYNIQNSLSRMDKFSNQLSTGKKYVLAEDDPINAVLGMHFRTKITESEQFIRNIEDGKEWMDTCDTTLGHITDLFRDVRDLAIYGANDTLVQGDRDALAQEADQLLNGILDAANTEFKGDFIFSGAQTRIPPFKAFTGEDPGESPNVTTHDFMNPDHPDRINLNMKSITRVGYQGDSSEINRQLQQSLSISINDTGNNIFQAETHSVTSGSMMVSDQNAALNAAVNFDNTLDEPAPPPGYPEADPQSTSFTVGVKDGAMSTINYHAGQDSIIDIAEKINEKGIGVEAEVKKLVVDNVDYFKLEVRAKESGKEIEFFDSDKANEKKGFAGNAPAFNPDTDPFSNMHMADVPTGEVFINGKQFVLSDYTTVRQFMNDVVNDEDAHVSEFTYDNGTGEFRIKADKGHALEIKEKGDINTPGNVGFFSGIGINTSGNFLDSMKMFNKVEGRTSVGSKNALLNTIPGMESGKIVVNGAVVDVDVEADSLGTLAKKINEMNVGVRATVEEDTDPAGNFRLVMRSLHPGKMQLEDRGQDILSDLGFIDSYDHSYYDYPSEISDPQDIGIFSVVMSIRDNLYKGDNYALEDDLARLDEVYDSILEYRSKIGAKMVAADTSQSKLEDVRINTTNLLSNAEDVDVAEVIMKMKMEENVQSAAMQTGASIIQKSLIDFIR